MKELLDTMERRANERAEAILAEGRDEAGRIRADAEREVERRRGEHRERVERAAAAEAARGLSDARREAAALELGARREALDRVFDRARDLLSGPAARDAWREHAPVWLERALAYAPPEGATVVCDPATASALPGAASAGITVAARDDAPPGLVVRGGSVEVDATLPGLLERRRERLAIEVLARLEDEGKG